MPQFCLSVLHFLVYVWTFSVFRFYITEHIETHIKYVTTKKY